MEVSIRLTHTFAEISVDEVTTTVFKNSSEPNEVIENLLSVIEDLCKLTDRDFEYNISDKS